MLKLTTRGIRTMANNGYMGKILWVDLSKKTIIEEEPSEENQCPYGHVFGKDVQEYDDCDNCEVWDDCMEASD